MKPSINIITNEGGRVNQLLPLFIALNRQGFGKLVENWYFCISSDIYSNGDRKEEILFSSLQKISLNRGFGVTMYIIK